MVKVGDAVRSYQVTEEINVGLFCNAYFVTDGSDKFFMKEYSDPKPSDMKEFVPFYENQKVLVEKLNSMGSIAEKFVDHFVENNLYYQVKESLYGMSLEKYFEDPREYEDRRLLGVILCGVVKNMHQHGIVHQDLKPAQIMLVNDEIGKKTKLGYRIILSDFDWSIPDGRCAQIVGTPLYKSPEHYRNQTPLPQSDIYTVGVMLYEFLTGRNPFDFDDDASDGEYGKRVLARRINKEPKAWNAEISDEINRTILRCLDPDPKKRPPLDEVQTALVAAKAGGKMSRVALVWGASRFIVYGDREFGRAEMKQFFRDMADSKGNLLYKYCDDSHAMLRFSCSAEGAIEVSAPEPSKNYFMLNDDKIGSGKLALKSGDKLLLYSTIQAAIVGTLDVT